MTSEDTVFDWVEGGHHQFPHTKQFLRFYSNISNDHIPLLPFPTLPSRSPLPCLDQVFRDPFGAVDSISSSAQEGCSAWLHVVFSKQTLFFLVEIHQLHRVFFFFIRVHICLVSWFQSLCLCHRTRGLEFKL